MYKVEKSFDDVLVAPKKAASASEVYENYLYFLDGVKAVEKKKKRPLSSEESSNFFKEFCVRRNGKALFRKSSGSNDPLADYWLATVKKASVFKLSCSNVSLFQGLDKTFLTQLAKKSTEKFCFEEIDRALSSRGVVLVIEDSIPGMGIDGAVFNLTSSNPVIAMSLRYGRIDYFWFTLMHELSHLVMHYDELENPIVDDLESTPETLVERQADRLASDVLIPRHKWRSSQFRRSRSKNDLYKLARNVGVHPAIVAGRLRKELNRYDIFSDIVNEVDVRELLNG